MYDRTSRAAWFVAWRWWFIAWYESCALELHASCMIRVDSSGICAAAGALLSTPRAEACPRTLRRLLWGSRVMLIPDDQAIYDELRALARGLQREPQ